MTTRSLFLLAATLCFASAARADYPDLVTADAPLVYYRFEETPGATSLTDSSGNTLDIDFSAAVGTTQLGEPGAVGLAARFNGDGSLLTPLMLDPSIGDFTLEALIKPAAIEAAGGVYISNQDGTGTGRSNLLVNGDYNLNSFVGGATSSAGPIATEGEWYHVILTYDQSAVATGIDPTLRFYINGVAEGTSLQVAEPATGAWVLGSNKNQTSQFFSGLLDEVAIYDFRLDDPDGDGDTADSRVGIHYETYLASDVIKSFTADMTTITSGSSATLAWEVADPTSVLTLDDGSGPVDVLPDLVDEMGSIVVSPTEETTYTLVATGGTQDCTELAEITIRVDSLPVIEAFTASTTDTVEGEPVSLSWVVTDADEVSIDNGVGLLDPASGTTAVVINSTTTFTLSATNTNGSSSAQLTVDAAAPGLVAHWRVGEADGEQAGSVLIAEQGSSFDGSFFGTPSFDSSDPAPVPDGSTGSIVFDGLNSYVDVLGYNGIPNTTSRTVAFWFKGAGTQTNNHGTILSWGNNTRGSRYDTRVSPNPTATLRTEVNGSGSQGTAIIADDTWHHVAAVLTNDGDPDISEIVYYVDGIADGLAVVGNTPIDTNPLVNLRIGASRTLGGRSLTGKLDDIRIYNYPLGADEVLGLVESSVELKITGVRLLPGNDVELTWSGAPGDYAIDYSFDLRNWLELDDSANIAPGETTGTAIDDFIAPDEAITRIYYRVKQPE